MNWPDVFDGGKVITCDWSDLVITRLPKWGVSVRVAQGGLHLVYDAPIQLLLNGKLDVVETLLVVLMALAESGVRWIDSVVGLDSGYPGGGLPQGE